MTGHLKADQIHMLLKHKQAVTDLKALMEVANDVITACRAAFEHPNVRGRYTVVEDIGRSASQLCLQVS